MLETGDRCTRGSDSGRVLEIVQPRSAQSTKDEIVARAT